MLDWFQPVTWVFIILAAVWLDFRLMRYLKANKDQLAPVVIFGRRIPVLSAVYTVGIGIRSWFNRISFSVVTDSLSSFHPVQTLRAKAAINDKLRANILTNILPVVIICAWAIWVGRGYLNFDPNTIPNGGDYPHQIYGHYGLYPLKECGTCVFWNGYLNGGQPTFAEVQGATMHPVTIVSTLLLGAVNGSKIILLFTFIIAGLAQWWLARVMGLGTLAGLWAAGIVIVGGHYGDRIGRGMVNVGFATACATLIIPPLIDLLRYRQMRSAVLVGLFLGLTLLAGQGYTQLAVFFGIFPATCIYLFSKSGFDRKLRNLLIFSIVLALLLSAVLWLPVMHFMPEFTKYGDPHFGSSKPFDIIPLNLILRGDQSLFVGWIPVILALLTLHFVPSEKKKLVWFLFSAPLFIFLISSSSFLKFVYRFIPQVGYLRFPDVMMILAVPFIIALSSWTLDYLLKSKLIISLKSQSSEISSISFSWILFPLLLLLTIPPAYQFSQWRYNTHPVERPTAVMDWLSSPSTTEWIRTHTPDFDWVPIAMQHGLKVTDVWRPWYWQDRKPPAPYLEATPDEVASSELKIDYLNLIRHDGNRYAAISISTPDGGFFPCQAKAVGGHIDVSCTSDVAGTLTVQENYFSGWTVKVDGVSAPLYKSDWLKVATPPGSHTYTFRYRPWDVWVGMALSLIGIIVAVFAWKKDRV
jgi:hypothetical protein